MKKNEDIESLLYKIKEYKSIAMMRLFNAPLFDLTNKTFEFETQKVKLINIFNSEGYTKKHEKQLEEFAETVETVADINKKYVKHKLSLEEYIIALITALEIAIKEES